MIISEIDDMDIETIGLEAAYLPGIGMLVMLRADEIGKAADSLPEYPELARMSGAEEESAKDKNEQFSDFSIGIEQT